VYSTSMISPYTYVHLQCDVCTHRFVLTQPQRCSLQKISNDTSDLHPGVLYMSLSTFVCAYGIPYLVPTSIATTSTAAYTQTYAIIAHTHLPCCLLQRVTHMPMIPMTCGACTTRLHVRAVGPYTCGVGPFTCATCVHAHVRSSTLCAILACVHMRARQSDREKG
jgi:hypothetical protein